MVFASQTEFAVALVRSARTTRARSLRCKVLRMLLCLAVITVVGLSCLELARVGSEWVVRVAFFEGMFSRRARARVRIGDIAEARGSSEMVQELQLGLRDGGGM